MTDPSPEIGISVVIDDHPRFLCEFALWALCASEHLSLSQRVYFVSCRPDGPIRLAERLGIDVRFTEPLLPEHPHCNKLIPLLDEDSKTFRAVADADLFFCRDIRRFFTGDSIRLPPNNHAVPPLETFETLFRLAGIERAPEPGLALFKGWRSRETYAGNVSAGLIYVPESQGDAVNEWLDMIRWLSERTAHFPNYANHLDQISLALTVAKHKRPFEFLPAQTNAVLELLPQLESLYAMHLTSGHIPKFPGWFAPDGTLIAEQVNPKLSDAIDGFNENVRAARSLLQSWPETREFAPNFLNPAWRR